MRRTQQWKNWRIAFTFTPYLNQLKFCFFRLLALHLWMKRICRWPAFDFLQFIGQLIFVGMCEVLFIRFIKMATAPLNGSQWNDSIQLVHICNQNARTSIRCGRCVSFVKVPFPHERMQWFMFFYARSMFQYHFFTSYRLRRWERTFFFLIEQWWNGEKKRQTDGKLHSQFHLNYCAVCFDNNIFVLFVRVFRCCSFFLSFCGKLNVE